MADDDLLQPLLESLENRRTDVADEHTTLGVEGRAKVQSVIDDLTITGEAIGGWTAKFDARQTGVSYHAKFEKKVSVQTAMEWANELGACPSLLVNACERLLAADAEIERLRAEVPV